MIQEYQHVTLRMILFIWGCLFFYGCPSSSSKALYDSPNDMSNISDSQVMDSSLEMGAGVDQGDQRVNCEMFNFDLLTSSDSRGVQGVIDEQGVDMGVDEMAGVEMVGAEMAGAETAGTEMVGPEMSGVEMAGVEMTGAEMAGVEMTGAEMAGVEMAGVEMTGAEMAGAEMAGVEMTGAEMTGAEMAGAEMAGVETAGVESEEIECISVAEFNPSIGATHIPSDPIIYEQVPPSSGPHRPQWGKWGEYSTMPPERWLHNLEHGGIAFLYHPCAPVEMIEEMRSFARSYPPDEVGEFRWILTPYHELRTPIAIVAWEWTLVLNCFNEAEISDFIEYVYRRAPEDVVNDGSYSEGWIGR